MRLEHVGIWVNDLERIRAFYETYLCAQSNAEYTNEQKGFSSYFLTFEGGSRIEIMHMPSIPETRNDPDQQFTGLIHIAISVGSKEKVDSITSQLRADGYKVLDGPRTTGDGYYESLVLDPEGNRVEITV
jgi:lactoylglutathione lyase